FERAWRRIEAAQESGEPIPGSVIEVVKGGLIIDLGVRGFLPASLVDIRRVPNLDEFLGQTLESKVIELNRSRNNVVLSRRAVLEEQRREDRERILDRPQPGLIVEGQISNIVDFGAFVDRSGIDGLIHISEPAQHHVENPREVVLPGDEIRVKILEIDSERRRLSLSVKRVEGQVLPSERRGGGAVPGEAIEVDGGETENAEEEDAIGASGGSGEAGDLDDVPSLGLSEDVFSDNPEQPEAAATEEPEAAA